MNKNIILRQKLYVLLSAQIKIMKFKVKNIFRRTWGLFMSSGPTWDKIASEKISEPELRQYFVFPWIAFCFVIVLIFDSIYNPTKGLEKGILDSIITTVSFLGGYFLSNKICFWYLSRLHIENLKIISSEKIVSYSFTIIFVLKIITTILPGLFFLQILSVYVAFMVWEGCRSVLKLNEDERGNIVLVFTLAIILIPVIINKLIFLVVPNI